MKGSKQGGRPGSVSKQLHSALWRTVIVTVLVFLFILISMNVLANKITAQTELYQIFNQLFAQAEQVERDMFNMQYTGAEAERQACWESLRRLTAEAEAMRALCPSRAVEDLYHHVGTYVETAGRALDVRAGGSGSWGAYAHQQYVGNLLQERYSRVYESVSDTYALRLAYYKRLQAICLVISLLMGSAYLVAATWNITAIARRFTAPVTALAEAARRVNLGELETPALPTGENNELGLLIDTFDSMLARIRSQMLDLQDKYRIESQLREQEVGNLKLKSRVQQMQYQMLCAQINPHFLFNALGSVSATAYCENAEKTAALCTSLASFLRYALRDLNRTITVQDEVENVKDYLFIQQMRYGSDIYVDVNIESGCDAAALPSMVLQPLVENAFVHGWQTHEGSGTERYIGITVYRAEDCVCLSVFDNGCGMPPAKVNELNSILEQEDDTVGESIGVYNVLRRLQIFCGGSLRYRFASKPGEFTEVTIQLPDRKGEPCTGC